MMFESLALKYETQAGSVGDEHRNMQLNNYKMPFYANIIYKTSVNKAPKHPEPVASLNLPAVKTNVCTLTPKSVVSRGWVVGSIKLAKLFRVY